MKTLFWIVAVILVLVVTVPVKAEWLEVPVGDEFGYYLSTAPEGDNSRIESITVELDDGSLQAHIAGEDYICAGYEVHWLGDHLVTGKNYGAVTRAWVSIMSNTAPLPEGRCAGGIGFETKDLEREFFYTGMGDGWLTCQVSYQTTSGIVTTHQDQWGDYIVKGIGADWVAVTYCPTCESIEALWVYFQQPEKVYIPMLPYIQYYPPPPSDR